MPDLSSMGDRLCMAVTQHDLSAVANVTDSLRYHTQMNYWELSNFATHHTGLGSDEWEALLDEVDQLESMS